MAVLSGFLPEASIHGYDRLYLTGDLDDYSAAWIDALAYWDAAPIPGIEALITHWPVSTTPLAKSGHIALSYYDDFYNRVHITPRVLDIGNLLSVQTRDVSVWNAWLAPKALSSIGETGTEGLAESGIAAPTTFATLEERTYSVTVDTNGPAAISALYTFVFPAESPTLEVTGGRVVVFSYPPNWADSVNESYEWLTDVLEAYGGVEQRIGLRGVPRRGLSYSMATTERHASNRLETLLLGWQSRLFAVPVWTECQTLASALSIGATSIPCETSGYEFAPGDLVVLWRAHDVYESVEIDSVNVNSLMLVSATLAAWPAGTKVLPLRLGRLPSAQKLNRDTDHHFSARVEFRFDDHPGWAAADVGDTYLGYRVYPLKPNWAGDIDVELMRKLAELDYNTGRRWVDDESGLANIVKRWNWTHGSRAEIVAFRAWLAARKGRLTPFWSETQGDDMELAAPIGASDGSIQIRNIGYKRYLDGRADRRHLAIRTKAGAAYYRQITGATENSDTVETLAIDSALGALVNPADISSLRFLHLTRLESDSIDIEWLRIGLAQTTAAMRSLPQ